LTASIIPDKMEVWRPEK